jgi:hypothetical protein
MDRGLRLMVCAALLVGIAANVGAYAMRGGGGNAAMPLAVTTEMRSQGPTTVSAPQHDWERGPLNPGGATPLG